MTIQAFARLCGCNPQTLRYYDKVDLLRPARVDRFTGYRYYDEDQALTFVKIKNLQLGAFPSRRSNPSSPRTTTTSTPPLRRRSPSSGPGSRPCKKYSGPIAAK